MLTDSHLFDFINTLGEPAHLKNAENNKYLFSNKNNSMLFGIEDPNQLVNLTVKDISLFAYESWWQNYAKIVNHLDLQVIHRKCIINDERTILVSSGVRFQKMVKIPILNDRKKVTSIFTFSQNLTDKIKLRELYELYRKFYNKSMAILKFLDYLQISYLFIELPTEAELYILLTKTLFDNNKQVSSELGISTRTVESHITKLRYKIKNGSMNSVIITLRQKYVT